MPIDPEKTALIEQMMIPLRPHLRSAQALEQYKLAYSKDFKETFRNECIKNNQDPAHFETSIHHFEHQTFALMADRLSWDKLKPRFTEIYDETFTKQELTDIIAFYKTPSGQSLLKKTPDLMAKASQVGQEQMSSALGEIQRLTEAFMQDMQGLRSPRQAEKSIRSQSLAEFIGARQHLPMRHDRRVRH